MANTVEPQQSMAELVGLSRPIVTIRCRRRRGGPVHLFDERVALIGAVPAEPGAGA